MADIWSSLQRRQRSAGASPLITFVDTLRGERTELSATSLMNAAAKIANALRDELGAAPGTVIGMNLPLHWQRTTWCAGAWTAGCVVEPGSGLADIVVTTPTGAAKFGGEREIAVVSMHPFGLPVTAELPPGAFDVTLSVQQQPDAYLFDPPESGSAALLLGDQMLTHDALLRTAAERAGSWGLTPGGTLLISQSSIADGWICALAAPLALDSSVVLVAGPIPDDLVERERVTAIAR